MAGPSGKTVVCKLWKTAKILGLLAAALCFDAALAIVVYDCFAYYQARSLLADVQRIEPGKTKVETAIELAKRRGGTASATFRDGRAILDQHVKYQYVPFERCKTNDCIVSIPAPSAYEWNPFWWYRYPKLLGWLPFEEVYFNRFARRFLPQTVLAQPTLTIRDGVVQEVTVVMAGSLVDQSSCPEVAVHHYGNFATGTPWNVRTRTTFHTGGDCGPKAPGIRVDISPDATEAQQRFAYALNLRCQWPGTSCTECEMLPGICEDRRDGNWYYFTMPGEQLDRLKNGVNHLRIGAERGEFEERLTFNSQDGLRSKFESSIGISPVKYRADWDPRRMWLYDDESGSKLAYYVKRWRAWFEEDSRDQVAVILIFDGKRRLLKIESHIDGIRSRP